MSNIIPPAAMVFKSATLQGNMAPVPGPSAKQGQLEIFHGKVYNPASYRSLAFSSTFTNYLGTPVPFVQCWEFYTTYQVNQQVIPRPRGSFIDVSQRTFLNFCQFADGNAAQKGVAPLGRQELESGWIQELLRKLEHTWDACVQQLLNDGTRPGITTNEQARQWLLDQFERAIRTRLSGEVQRHWENKGRDVVRRSDRAYEDDWMEAFGIQHRLPDDTDSDDEFGVADALEDMNMEG